MSIDQNYDRTAKYNAFSPRDSPREGKKLWESRKKLWDSYNDQTNSESIEGVLRVNKKNRNEGYVRTNEKDWFIPSLNLMNRALDSAKVKIAKLSPKEAEKEKLKLKIKKQEFVKKNALLNQKFTKHLDIDEDVESDLELDKEDDRIYAKVINVIEDNWDAQHSGTIHACKPNTNNQSRNLLWFKPTDNRIPYILLETYNFPAEYLTKVDSNNVFVCKITKWDEYSQFPKGEFIKIIGEQGLIETEQSQILLMNKITWDEFSVEIINETVANLTPVESAEVQSMADLKIQTVDESMADMKIQATDESMGDAEIQATDEPMGDAEIQATDELKVQWEIPASEYEKRKDLRNVRIFSIDPPTARDLDDALSIELLKDGTYSVGVHIADVSFFIKPDSLLDAEARNRSTSVYLTQRVISMLPRILCEEYCSLNENVDRLARSVFWNITKEGEILGTPRFEKSVIRSCARLWYDHAQACIDKTPMSDVSDIVIYGGFTEEDIEKDVLLLYNISKILRQKRVDNGSLSLDSVKLWFNYDDKGIPTEFGAYEQKDANRLIEEFMLLANISVAEQLYEHYPQSALLRKHEEPVEKSLEETRVKLLLLDVVIDTESSFALNQSLLKIDEDKARIVRQMLIKSMRRAEYYTPGPDEFVLGHYALSIPLYTHYTSPIRRYCDIYVHRQLESIFESSSDSYDPEEAMKIAENCNKRKNQASDAQDQSGDLYLCLLLKREGDVQSDAYVLGVSSRSFDVYVPEYGIEKRVWMEDCEDEINGLDFDDNAGLLVVLWKMGKQEVGVFDKVRVKVSVDMTKSPPAIKLYLINPFIV
jgi:protein SSD1